MLHPVPAAWSNEVGTKLALLAGGLKTLVLGQEARAVMAEMENSRVKIDEAARLPQAPLHYPYKIENTSDFETEATSGLAMDLTNQDILFAKNSDQLWSIASITKLITAMVFLDRNPGWDKTYEVKKADRREGGKIYLFPGDKVKVKDLFYLSLVGSGNSETISLVNSTGLTEAEFVVEMNKKMQTLGMTHTVFFDAVGLNDKNVSTAFEVAKIAAIALEMPDINKTTLTRKFELVTEAGRKKTIYSTDELLGLTLPDEIKLLGGKTGHTDKAGYCFVSRFSNMDGNRIISVILGGADNDSRFTETKHLVEWTYNSYRWR